MAAPGACQSLAQGYARLTQNRHIPSLALGPSTTTLKECAMLWKLLGLQRILDTLFDDAWAGLGFAPSNGAAVSQGVGHE